MSGLAIFAGEIARFDCGDAFSWVALLRRTPCIDVPAHETDALMARLANSPALPEVEGIDQLGWQFIDVVPTPTLRVELPKQEPTRGHAARVTIPGSLCFEYPVSDEGEGGGEAWLSVAFSDLRSALLRIPSRHLVRRCRALLPGVAEP